MILSKVDGSGHWAGWWTCDNVRCMHLKLSVLCHHTHHCIIVYSLWWNYLWYESVGHSHVYSTSSPRHPRNVLQHGSWQSTEYQAMNTRMHPLNCHNGIYIFVMELQHAKGCPFHSDCVSYCMLRGAVSHGQKPCCLPWPVRWDSSGGEHIEWWSHGFSWMFFWWWLFYSNCNFFISFGFICFPWCGSGAF